MINSTVEANLACAFVHHFLNANSGEIIEMRKIECFFFFFFALLTPTGDDIHAFLGVALTSFGAIQSLSFQTIL